MRVAGFAFAAIIAAGCGSKKREEAPPATSARDGGGPAGTQGPNDVLRCLKTLERAARLPAEDRGGAIVRGCGLCTANWDPLIAADHADTGGPVDLAAVAATVDACGGFCTNQAKAAFKQHLGDLVPGKPATRPWKTLAADCADAMRVTPGAERFASGSWFALAAINRRIVEARAQLPAADQARLDAALAALYLPLPPVSAPGTGFVVPGGSRRPGTPWRHVTVTGEALFAGALPFVRMTGDGLTIADGGAPYPGRALAMLGELAAALDTVGPAHPPGANGGGPWIAPPAPPELPGRIDEPVIIAPRAAAARSVIEVLAALGPNRAYLGVASPAPAALWRGLVAAHPLPLAARDAAPPGRRLRFSLATARVAVVDDKGAVLASAPLPMPDRLLVERWAAAALAIGRGHTVEVVAAEGKVDELAALLDAVAAGGAVLAVPAPAPAPMTGADLPAFDAPKLSTVLGPPPLSTAPSPTRPAP